jgi:hypothetical protein
LYDPNANQENQTETATDVKENVKRVFGVDFSADQDWSMLVNNKVTIKADADLADVAKVRVVSVENGEINILNEASVQKNQTVELSYDAPKGVSRLFAACVAADGTYKMQGFTVGQTTVSFRSGAAAKAHRRAFENAQFPELPIIKSFKKSYNLIKKENANRGVEDVALWKDTKWNDKFYLQDEEKVFKIGEQYIAVDELADDEKADLQAIISSFLPAAYFKSGQRYNENFDDKIVPSDGLFVYQNNHLVTLGDKPIRVAPVYMSGQMGGCNLFYYYFKPEQVTASGMSEDDFIRQLPKYQLALKPYGDKEHGFLGRQELYTLAYYGDGEPTVGQQAESFIFPEGYKIGFVLRNFDRQGELYGDGRLNTEVNQWKSFALANLAPNTSRVAAFGANNKNYLCFEDGTDQDYDDLILELESGVVSLVNYDMDMRSKVYTFAFEDRDLGDYDMNDVVIKAQRLNDTQVKYSLEATGAYDELYIRGVKNATVLGSKEVHALFGVAQNTFVNTKDDRYQPIQEIVNVEANFSFSRPSDQPYIFNKTTGKEIHVSMKGEDPHSIVVPCDWQYPLERICVGGTSNPAFKQFNNWGQGNVSSTDWYLHPENGKVYTLSVFK